MTHCLTDYLNFCADVVFPVKTVTLITSHGWHGKSRLSSTRRMLPSGAGTGRPWRQHSRRWNTVWGKLRTATGERRSRSCGRITRGRSGTVWGPSQVITQRTALQRRQWRGRLRWMTSSTGLTSPWSPHPLTQPPQTQGTTRPGPPAVCVPARCWRGGRRVHSNLDKGSSTVRILFLDFSNAFNTIQSPILQDKLNRMGVDPYLVDWIKDYLTDRPQYVRLKDTKSDTEVSSTGAPQGTVLASLLLTLYTSDFCYNSELCHRSTPMTQALLDVWGVTERRSLVGDYVLWCHTDCLQLNTSKMKELVIDFGRSRPRPLLVLLEGAEVEAAQSYKYLRLWLDNGLDDTH